MTSKKAVFFHVDMDAFFASVEQRDNPSFRGKPVIVGARPGTRGVVSAASYEARSYGVHSAMPISEAVRRCPGAVFAVPRFSAYSHASEEIMNTLAEFSPRVDQVSVDEAFLDMTGTQRLWGEPLATAQKIKKRIWDTQHLTASIGIAPNKFLSKLASDINKPDGITITPFCHDAIKSWLAPLPVKSMWGVGKKSETALGFLGVYTIGDLQNTHE